MLSSTTYPPRTKILPDRQACAGISPENACYKQWASQQPTYCTLELGNEEAWDSELHVNITSPDFAITTLPEDMSVQGNGDVKQVSKHTVGKTVKNLLG